MEDQSGVQDMLGPRESGILIAQNSDLITIDASGVNSAANLIIEAYKSGDIGKVEFSAHELHPKGADQAAVDWIFLVNTINFSFWSEKSDPYVVSYNGKSYTGYFAACACVNRSLDQGIPLTSADYMANIAESDVENIFRADSGRTIPMVEERVGVIRESGRVLKEKFGGTFYNCLQQSNRSAQELLRLIVDNFPGFRDIATFQGHNVSILKRAQILVADIYGSITMFADYRVPQALAYLGVLRYPEKLLKILKSGELMESGSEAEVALRGFSIRACDLIVDAVKQLAGSEEISTQVNAVLVDIFLWTYRREHAEEIEKTIPFHRIRCIYY
ncbi:Protein C11D2.4 [Aphelenchoides avenae]|nr:Protein C11D2.4 [Aphelenchus avenae]